MSNPSFDAFFFVRWTHMNGGNVGGLTNFFLRSIQNICSDQSKEPYNSAYSCVNSAHDSIKSAAYV